MPSMYMETVTDGVIFTIRVMPPEPREQITTGFIATLLGFNGYINVKNIT